MHPGGTGTAVSPRQGLCLPHLPCHLFYTQPTRQSRQAPPAAAPWHPGPAGHTCRQTTGLQSWSLELDLPAACKARQVQGPARPHTPRKWGERQPQPQPSVVEGWALPSGTWVHPPGVHDSPECLRPRPAGCTWWCVCGRGGQSQTSAWKRHLEVAPVGGWTHISIVPCAQRGARG